MVFSCKRAVLLAACALVFPVHAQDKASADPVWRASSRLGYGPTEALVAEISQRGGPRAWALQQIEVAHKAGTQPARMPAELTHFNLPLEQIFEAFREEREARKAAKDSGPKKDAGPRSAANMENDLFSRDAAREAAVWRIAACSAPAFENPLLARMTEFWFNHLNVFAGKGAVRPFVGHYVLNAIRPNALGKFEDLLLASARHPAMLFYLDQAQSVADGSAGPQGRARGLN